MLNTVKEHHIAGVVIFTFTLGKDASTEIPTKIALFTNGLHKHVSDKQDYELNKAITLYYLYYTKQKPHNTDIILTSPYYDFSTEYSLITMAMPMYYKDEYFVGVVAIDIPLSFLAHTIGDVLLGTRSSYFIINKQSQILIHPDIEDYLSNYQEGQSVIEDKILTEYKSLYINNLEPEPFVSNVLPSMIKAETGWKVINATVKLPAGDTLYNGYTSMDVMLLYIYAPVGPGSLLSIAFKVNQPTATKPPMVPQTGLNSVPEIKCDTIIHWKDSSGCSTSFNLFHDLDRMIECNVPWIGKAGIKRGSNESIFGWRSEFYGNQWISLDYPGWYIEPGMWINRYNAINSKPSCEALKFLHNLSNIGYEQAINLQNLNGLPFGGFATSMKEHIFVGIYMVTWFTMFGKSSFLAEESPFIQTYFGSQVGFHTTYPAFKLPLDYDPRARPWYQRATSYPDLFVFTTPYMEEMAQKLILSGATTIDTPANDLPYGVAAFDFEYVHSFVEYWTGIMGEICDVSQNFVCYLIDSSAFILYHDGMEKHPNAPDISTKFLGSKEPTLMQSLLQRKLFIKNEDINYQNDSIDITYMIDQEWLHQGNFSTISAGFEHNKGRYTVHDIYHTNLYMIHIENYDITQIYPWQCPYDILKKCDDVIEPGCKRSTLNGDCVPAQIDVCDEMDVIYELLDDHDDECDDNVVDKYSICVMEYGDELDMCSSELEQSDKCKYLLPNSGHQITVRNLWIFIGILLGLFVVFMIFMILRWKREYDHIGNTHKGKLKRSKPSKNVLMLKKRSDSNKSRKSRTPRIEDKGKSQMNYNYVGVHDHDITTDDDADLHGLNMRKESSSIVTMSGTKISKSLHV